MRVLVTLLLGALLGAALVLTAPQAQAGLTLHKTQRDHLERPLAGQSDFYKIPDPENWLYNPDLSAVSG
ncbi:hypothetical protein LCGC14_2817060, partial [marine sediment metagenome]